MGIALWLGFIMSINVSLCYLPSHEAQHNIIARRGQPLRWLNEVVGHLSVIPLFQPYELRDTHMEHHATPTIHSWIQTIQYTHRGILEGAIKNRQPYTNAADAYSDA